MTKQNLSAISALVIGATLTTSLPALAQQVQVNGGGTSQQEPAARSNSQPNQTVQVNNAPAQPAPQGTTNVNVQTNGEGGFMTRPAGRLMVSGATLFGVFYTATVLGAAIASDVCKEDNSLGCREAQWPVYIPIVGPFIQMGYMSGTGANTGRAILAIDGGLQALGAGMFIAGAIMYGANAGRSNTQVAKRIQLAPYNAAGGGGLMAFGRF